MSSAVCFLGDKRTGPLLSQPSPATRASAKEYTPTPVPGGPSPECTIINATSTHRPDAARGCRISSFATRKDIARRRLGIKGHDDPCPLVIGDMRGHVYMLSASNNTYSLLTRTGIAVTAVALGVFKLSEVILTLSDGTLHCYHQETGKSLSKVPTHHRSLVHSIIVHPFQPRILTVASTEVILWDSLKWTRLQLLDAPPDSTIAHATFSPSGDSMIISFRDTYVYIFDASSLSLKWRIKPSASFPTPTPFLSSTQIPGKISPSGGQVQDMGIGTFTISSDERFIVVAGWACIKIWDAIKGKPLRLLAPDGMLQSPVKSMEFLADTLMLLVHTEDDRIWLVDIEEGEPTLLHTIPLVKSYAVTPDGGFLIIQPIDIVSTCVIWSLVELAEVPLPDQDHPLLNASISPSSARPINEVQRRTLSVSAKPKGSTVRSQSTARGVLSSIDEDPTTRNPLQRSHTSASQRPAHPRGPSPAGVTSSFRRSSPSPFQDPAPLAGGRRREMSSPRKAISVMATRSDSAHPISPPAHPHQRPRRAMTYGATDLGSLSPIVGSRASSVSKYGFSPSRPLTATQTPLTPSSITRSHSPAIAKETSPDGLRGRSRGPRPRGSLSHHHLTTSSEEEPLDDQDPEEERYLQEEPEEGDYSICETDAGDRSVISIMSQCPEEDLQTPIPSSVQSTMGTLQLQNVSKGGRRLLAAQLKLQLHRQGYFPIQHRPVIWTFFLQLPENLPAYTHLLSLGPHPCLELFRQRFQLPDPHMQGLMESAMSILGHWSPHFQEDLSFLPLLAFPFVKFFKTDPYVGLETLLTIMVRWCPDWWSTFPDDPSHPPTDIASIHGLVRALELADPQMAQHFASLGIPVHDWGWTPLRSMLSDVLSPSHWAYIWDNIVCRPPRFLYLVLIAILIQHRSTILKMTSREDILTFWGTTQDISPKRIVQMTRRLCRDPNYQWDFSPSSPGIWSAQPPDLQEIREALGPRRSALFIGSPEEEEEVPVGYPPLDQVIAAVTQVALPPSPPEDEGISLRKATA